MPIARLVKRYWSPYKSIFIAIVSLFIALFATSFDSIDITDRTRYIVHILSADDRLFRYLSDGVVAYLVNEPLWKLINYGLYQAFDNPLDAIKFYVFIVSFVVSYIVLSHDVRYFPLLLAFILLPQFLKNYIAHLRQGVAISVFLIGWCGFSGRKQLFIILLTPFIHASFFFILFFIVAQKVLSYIPFTIVIRMILYFVIVSGMSIASLALAEAMGARQTSYEHFGADISGKGFIFWLAIFVLFFSQGGAFIKKHLLGMSVLLFYLVSYAFLPVAARVLESGLILVLLASLSLSPGRLLLFLPAFFFFFFMQWIPRLGIEGLGWIGT